MTSLFYVHNQGSPVKDFSVAVQSCGKFGATLAKLKSEKSASTALKIIAAASNSRWSTCVLVYFSWLLDHMIYLKLGRE